MKRLILFLILLSCSFNLYAQNKWTSDVTRIPGAVLDLKLNEGSGTSLFDSSGNGNSAVNTLCTWVSSGESIVFGSALQLNDSSCIFSVPASNSLQCTNALTVSIWVKTATTLETHATNGVGRNLIQKSGTNAKSWFIGMYNSSAAGQVKRIRVDFGTNTGALAYSGYYNFTPATSTYLNFVMTFNNGTMWNYYNGATIPTLLFLTISGTVPLTLYNNATTPIVIGGALTFNSKLAICIDEIRIYNRALSPRQVRAIYELEKIGKLK